jgi:hypothetical protein
MSGDSGLLIEEADYFHEITKGDWFTLPPKKGASRNYLRKPFTQTQTTAPG